MGLKTCPGEHHVLAACAACAEDDLRCDYCWEEHPEDLHDDLRLFCDDTEHVFMICPSCFSRATGMRWAEGRADYLYDLQKDDAMERGRK